MLLPLGILPRSRRVLLTATTALMGVTALFAASSAQAAFNPDADSAGTAPVSITRSRLPDTAVLREEAAPRPLYAPGSAPSPTVAGGYVSPLEPIKMPRPLYPSKSMAADAPVAGTVAFVQPEPVSVAPIAAPSTMPNLPPVDPATAAQAQAILQAENPAAPEPTGTLTPVAQEGGFIAPAPVLATTTPTTVTAVPVTAAPAVIVPASATPVVAAPAVAVPVAVAAVPSSDLSKETKNILAGVPSRIDSPKVEKPSKVNLSRVSPQIENVLGKDVQEQKFESVGLSIKVRRPGLDTNYELNQAYTALMGGDAQRAIEIYKNILGADPKNEDALFGLAATYHRLGQTEQARPFYGMLLKINPNHREALNNFLVLMSDESPQDALPELQRLEERNPDFSPIPAQIAILYDKLGYPDKAEEEMMHAIDLAPESLTYKYNLAIMLDHHRRYADAAALYRMLIQATARGEDVPASADSMQRRLNYITAAANEGKLGG